MSSAQRIDELTRVHAALRARWEETQDVKTLRVARHVHKRVKKLRRLSSQQFRDNPRAPKNLEKPLAPLRQAIEDGQRIVCIDCEWTPFRIISQIGLTSYQSGEIEYRHIEVGEMKKVPFKYGTPEQMSNDRARAFMRELLAQPFFFVGHSFKNDYMQLAKWGLDLNNILSLDIQSYFRSLERKQASLKDLHIRHGFKPLGAHVGGNDSAMIMHVVLAMVGRAHECTKATLLPK